MKRPSFEASRWRFAHTCALVAALVGGGCGDEVTDPCRPSVSVGKIQGRVRSGWEPVEATVRVTRIPEQSWDEARIEVPVVSDGSYWVDVPAGRYVVALHFEGSNAGYGYSAAGPRFGNEPPDTLAVDYDHSPVSADFDLASVHVHLDVSTELDGAYASVRLHRSEGGIVLYQYSSKAIANGAFDYVMSGVLPGMYRVETNVSIPSYSSGGERIWIPGVRDSADSPWFEVSTDRIIDVGGRFDGAPARIQGEVTGAWQTLGLPNSPSVGLVTPDSLFVTNPLSLPWSGKFDFKIALPTPVKMYVKHQDIVQWVGGRNFGEATVYELEPGRTISGIEYVQSGMRIDLQSPSGVPYEAQFNVYDAGTRELRAIWWYGYYGNLSVGIPNLYPGVYLLEIVSRSPGAQPWAPQWFDRVDRPEDATPITIASEGDVARIAVVLERGGTISGAVRDDRAATSRLYGVYLARADDPTRWGYKLVTDTYPAFAFEGLPGGEWKIGACWHDPPINPPMQPPPDVVWYPGTTSWSEAGIITTHNDEEVTGIEIVISDAPRPRKSRLP